MNPQDDNIVVKLYGLVVPPHNEHPQQEAIDNGRNSSTKCYTWVGNDLEQCRTSQRMGSFFIMPRQCAFYAQVACAAPISLTPKLPRVTQHFFLLNTL